MSNRKGAWRSAVLFFLDGFLIGLLFIRFGKPVIHRPVKSSSSDSAVVENIDVRDLLDAQHEYGLRHPSWRVRDTAIIEYPAPVNPNAALQLDSQSLGRELVKEIEDSVAPDTWTNSGGTVGVISLNDGALFIIQTPQNLRKIHELLDFLRCNGMAQRREVQKGEPAIVRRLPRILLALVCFATGFAIAKLVIPPREVWEKPQLVDRPHHPQLAKTVFRIGDLLEGEQPLVNEDQRGSEMESQSPFTRYLARRDELVKLIERKIAPLTWKDAGGLAGLRADGDKLFVEQTPANTEAIDRLLQSLRNGRGSGADLRR